MASTVRGYGDVESWSSAKTGDAPLKKWCPTRCSKPRDCRFCVKRVGCELRESASGVMEGIVHLAKGSELRCVPIS